MATGDLKNNLRRLQSKLKLISYPKDMDMKGISKGLAQEYLPLLHYILLEFSHPMAEHITNNDMELYGKSDDKFMIAVYKVLRDIFHYKPSITRQQFFSRGFAEHKIILVVDLIRMVKDKHKELTKASLGTRHVSGSLSRLRGSTPSREQVAPTRSAADPDQPTTPDLLTASATETTIFLPTTTEVPKAIEKDTGYHTAETSPTNKTPDEQDTKRTPVSVNELRAKFESSGLPKQDESLESKLSDMEIEDNPIIQALVKQIVYLEDQLTEMSEENKAWKAQVEKNQSDMEGRMVLMQNSIMLLESKVTTEQPEGKPVRSVLTQGIAQDVAKALLHPIRRRPEDVPLPDSPSLPRTPNHTPSSAKGPLPSLSISAVASDQEVLPSCQEDLSADSHKEPVDLEAAQEASSRYQHRPVSVVGPMVGNNEHPEPEVVTILGAASPNPMDTQWMHRSSSTPIEATAEDANPHRDLEAGVLDLVEAPASNDDDIDEGLVDVEDGDLGDYIVETVRDYSGEMQPAGDHVSEADEAADLELVEDEIDEVPVRDVGQAGAPTDEQNESEGVASQMQRVQDMLVHTQQMLAMNTSLTKDPPEDD